MNLNLFGINYFINSVLLFIFVVTATPFMFHTDLTLSERKILVLHIVVNFLEMNITYAASIHYTLYQASWITENKCLGYHVYFGGRIREAQCCCYPAVYTVLTVVINGKVARF
jgi:hypothetical protein